MTFVKKMIIFKVYHLTILIDCEETGMIIIKKTFDKVETVMTPDEFKKETSCSVTQLRFVYHGVYTDYVNNITYCFKKQESK